MKKYIRTKQGRFSSLRLKIRKFMAFAILVMIISTAYYGWANEWPEYAAAQINISRPVQDTRTVSQHVFDLLDEFDYTLDEKIELLTILKCESHLDPLAIGVNRDGSKDLGIVQWNEKYHPEIGRTCSFDVYCSVRKMAEYYRKNGNYNIWTCN